MLRLAPFSMVFVASCSGLDGTPLAVVPENPPFGACVEMADGRFVGECERLDP